MCVYMCVCAVCFVQDIFKLLGETVSLEYCRQRKGAGENRAKSEQDWVCFKVSGSCKR